MEFIHDDHTYSIAAALVIQVEPGLSQPLSQKVGLTSRSKESVSYETLFQLHTDVLSGMIWG